MNKILEHAIAKTKKSQREEDQIRSLPIDDFEKKLKERIDPYVQFTQDWNKKIGNGWYSFTIGGLHQAMCVGISEFGDHAGQFYCSGLSADYITSYFKGIKKTQMYVGTPAGDRNIDKFFEQLEYLGKLFIEMKEIGHSVAHTSRQVWEETGLMEKWNKFVKIQNMCKERKI